MGHFLSDLVPGEKNCDGSVFVCESQREQCPLERCEREGGFKGVSTITILDRRKTQQMKGENTIFHMHLFKSIWCIFYCINWITVATHDESIINKNCLQLYDHNKKHFLDWIRFNFISTNKKHFTQPRIFFFFDQSKFCQRHEMR